VASDTEILKQQSAVVLVMWVT